ncbi:hypothetical protein GHT06_021651 [Daphnia sinensis]|uniref:Uncharacterized protein n=1 Tax=Daphnia sinensis TaxID=1820382 RepID=A0AAD5KK21_9CRUS|nr:hypothetical protein GHT06_021651 [Daphnia sinensis]
MSMIHVDTATMQSDTRGVVDRALPSGWRGRMSNETKRLYFFLDEGMGEQLRGLDVTYNRVYEIWTAFCQENGMPEFGADHKQLAACLSLVMLRDGSYSKVVMLSSAIAHEYLVRMLPLPTVHETISLLFRGFRNEHPQMRASKSPITEDILSKMYFHLYRKVNGRDGLRASLVLWRTIWRRKDVIYKSSPSPHLQILFQGDKNHQYSEGSERIVASNINEEVFLWPPPYSGCLVPLCTAKNVPNPVKPVPYSSALSDLKKLLQLLGCDPKLYGEHSGKRGGATAAAAHGVTESQLKRLGGWRSDVMPSKYVDLSLPSRISMSQLLQKKIFSNDNYCSMCTGEGKK